MAPDAAGRGRLFLVPNTLDLGTCREGEDYPDLRSVLPLGAIQAAARIAYWVAENAKSARLLLKRISAVSPLEQPLQALQITELPRTPKGRGQSVAEDSIRRLLAPALEGHDVGLVSEAGLPAVADPGNALVMAAHAARVPVVPLAGPSSLMLALAASGLNGQGFAFVGYLPVDAVARQQRIRELDATSRRLAQTQIAIETPYRNPALLSALIATLSPGTRLSVSCGLTLASGFTRTATVTQWRSDPLALPADVPTVFCWQA